ncbi:MAG: hypothetical protein ACK559_41970, partial [bacterium]
NLGLVVRVLGLFILDEIRISNRLIVERDLLDLLFGFLFFLGAFCALGLLGLVGVVARLLGPDRTVIGIAQQGCRGTRPAHLHDRLGREAERALGAHDRLLA